MKESERKSKSSALMLTPKQEKAIFALLESQTLEDVALSVGVSRTALWTWMKIEPFRDKLMDARAELFREGMGQLKGSMAKAASVLVKLLDSNNANVRRLAAVAILSLGLKAHESVDLEARLEALEAAVVGLGERVRER